jgi:hypothetical protein
VDPVTIGFALLFALGLVGADAVLNAGSVMVDLEIGKEGSLQGVGEGLAEAVMCAEIQRVIDTKSIYRVPQLRGAREPSITSALTDLLKLGEVTQALQSSFGGETALVRASVSGDGRHKKLVVLGRSTYARGFSVEIVSTPDEPTIDLLRRAGFEIALRLEPYFAALHRVEAATDAATIEAARSLVKQLIDAGAELAHDPRRARYQNLLDILDLMDRQTEAAAAHFAAAHLADPDSAAPALNLAFLDVREGRSDRAIVRLNRLLGDPAIRHRSLLAAAASVTLAAAHAARGDHGVHCASGP